LPQLRIQLKLIFFDLLARHRPTSRKSQIGFCGEPTAMAIRIVRLGTERLPGEGIRFGTVRRPPRGIRKTDYASKNFYDMWLPMLAPGQATVKQALSSRSDRDWARFVKKYRAEMAAPHCRSMLDVLAALSHQADFSVGCYCADESRCHRSVLRELLMGSGAKVL
jgi:uncharacterized protein YeaO (DUF488 family)